MSVFFIAQSLRFAGFSSANDSNVLVIIRVRVGVDDNERHYGPDNADSVPPLVASLDPVGQNRMQRVVPYLAS